MSQSNSMSNPSKTTWDSLWCNATLATMTASGTPFGLVSNGAVGIQDGKIVWVGTQDNIPSAQLSSCTETFDCQGQLVTPGLIDCHTHLVYGGNRANEFEQRLKGASYTDIARAGGGIASTVNATRSASQAELFAAASQRLKRFLREGVTTIEIKSGYGLDCENELKMLRVARQLGEQFPVQVITTFLGAHATPPEFANNNDAYIDYVINDVLPQVAQEQLADAVDAFCENIAFSSEQVERVFKAAKEHNLPIKLHAEQLSDQKGSVLAARYKALSVDHLEYLAPDDVGVLKEHNTVAVLLPGAYYFLRETKLPPIDAFRKHSVPMALASDSNPGSSPVSSLLLMLNMACTLFKLTPEEALLGVTRHAAQALGKQTDIGTLEPGKTANLVCWQTNNPAELSYQVGANLCQVVMFEGSVAHNASQPDEAPLC